MCIYIYIYIYILPGATGGGADPGIGGRVYQCRFGSTCT